jgi:ribosomal protein L29
MAAIKKSEMEKMSPAERKNKIAELERAMLELRGEGRLDKVRPLKKAIAKLKTPQAPKIIKKQ